MTERVGLTETQEIKQKKKKSLSLYNITMKISENINKFRYIAYISKNINCT